MTTMQESRPPQPGQQHSYKLNPPTPVGCEVQWMINDQPVNLDSELGGLDVKGFGASGEMTVEVTGDISSTTVTAVIICPGRPPDTVGPMPVGTGNWAPPAGGPGIPVNPAALAFPLVDWPFWRKLIGGCPDEWVFGGANCACTGTGGDFFSVIPPRLWPFYYDISCTFTCPGPPPSVTTLTWTLSFGAVVDGPN